MLIQIYVNTLFQIILKSDFGLTENEAETYRECVFRSAYVYVLMFSFCLNCHFKPFFAMHITRFTNLLAEHMKEKFPKVKMDFYVSKRKNYVHMGLDGPLFLYTRNQQITDKFWSFMSDDLDKRFKPMFLQLIATVKWKYDYVIFQKKVIIKKKL